MKLLIIADDFTGAVDTGVQFSKRGVPLLVTKNWHTCFETTGADIEVLVVDIESRHIPPREAYGRVWDITKAAMKSGVKYYYKKTDSTLRGNIGAELTALLDASDCGGQLAFVPAYPKMGRTTINGVQYVEGTELAKSEYARDPFNPVGSSSVQEIISLQSGVKTLCVPLGVADVDGAESSGKTVRVFDAQTDDDIADIGRELKKADRLGIMAGCAGFAEILPELLGLRISDTKLWKRGGNIMIVSGSVNQAAIDQMDFAKSIGYFPVTLTPRQKLDRDFIMSDFSALIESVSQNLSVRKRVIIESVSSRDQIPSADDYAKCLGLPLKDVHELIARRLGEIVKAILEAAAVDNLVIFGGDTLSGIMDAIGCDSIFPITEIAPGVAAAIAASGVRDVQIVTKAGGFGDIEIVKTIGDFISGAGAPAPLYSGYP